MDINKITLVILPLFFKSAMQMSCKGFGSLARTITKLFEHVNITSTASANTGKDSIAVAHYFSFRKMNRDALNLMKNGERCSFYNNGK